MMSACGDDSVEPVPVAVPAALSPTPTAPPAESPGPPPTPQRTATATLTPPLVPAEPTPRPSPSPTRAPSPAPTATVEPTPTLTPTSTPVPSPTSVPSPTPTPGPLSPSQIFALVSPALAFVETPTGTGSGVLIEGGYVVTNAHVVWPFEEVRVVFPDGSEHPAAPVTSMDMQADLAIIGPLDTSVEPVALVDDENVSVGSEVFLVGYPGETERFPQPTISRGLLSRIRERDTVEMTYFQTDAAAASGQSGGALVAEDGRVIGISGLLGVFTEARFGLVASSADVLPRVERMIAGEDVSGLGDRRIPASGGVREHDLTLSHGWDSGTYVVYESPGTSVNIQVDGENDGAFFLIDPSGNQLIEADATLTGLEAGSAVIEREAPHFVFVGQFPDAQGEFRVRSNRDLVRWTDADDGRELAPEETVYGSIDYPLDIDYYTLDLAEGDTVDVTVDSASVDPFLLVDLIGADEEAARDDNSGGGILGFNASLMYRAPATGTYLVVVLDSNRRDIGGYVLTVSEALESAAHVSPAIPTPTPAPIASPFGPMKLYESASNPFSIQYPAEWTEQRPSPGLGIVAWFAGDQGEQLVIAEGETRRATEAPTLDAYVTTVLADLAGSTAGFELVSRETTTNAVVSRVVCKLREGRVLPVAIEMAEDPEDDTIDAG